jgi:hypothetical protein
MRAWKRRTPGCQGAAHGDCYERLMFDAERAFECGDFERAEALIARAQRCEPSEYEANSEAAPTA